MTTRLAVVHAHKALKENAAGQTTTSTSRFGCTIPRTSSAVLTHCLALVFGPAMPTHKNVGLMHILASHDLFLRESNFCQRLVRSNVGIVPACFIFRGELVFCT